MKALSLRQPRASLVALGQQRIHTREYSHAHRGPLAIHAAQDFPPSAQNDCEDDPVIRQLLEQSKLEARQLPRGSMVGVCQLRGCFLLGELLVQRIRNLEPGGCVIVQEWGGVKVDGRERALSEWRVGWYAWVFADARALASPIMARGNRYLWEWKWPRSLVFA